MTAPTLDAIYDALIDYADFEEVASVSRAKSFATAAKRFLLASPQSQSDQGSSLSMSVQQIETLYGRALNYIASQSTTVSFLGAGSNFR